VSEFKRLAANQNIDPEYVQMVGGVSEELKEINKDNCQHAFTWMPNNERICITCRKLEKNPTNDNVYFIAKRWD
tara:strand:- start:1487 stop:1708 length:222 start_codon:yes stop_codon:yes gene_type:complete